MSWFYWLVQSVNLLMLNRVWALSALHIINDLNIVLDVYQINILVPNLINYPYICISLFRNNPCGFHRQTNRKWEHSNRGPSRVWPCGYQWGKWVCNYVNKYFKSMLTCFLVMFWNSRCWKNLEFFIMCLNCWLA